MPQTWTSGRLVRSPLPDARESEMISYLLPTVRLIRPLNIWITFCAVLLGGWLALLQLQSEMFVASLSAALIAAAGYIQNDLIDIAADRVSHPHRPLPRRELPPSFARALSAFGYAGGIVLSSILSRSCLLTALGITLTLTLYNLYLKRLPLAGNVVVALVGGSPFVFGGLSVGHPGPALLPSALATVFHLSREILKDIQDQSGDRMIHGKTLPVVAGNHLSKVLVSVLLGGLAISIPLPAFWGIVGPIYLLVCLGLCAMLLLTICLLWQAGTEDELAAPSSLLKAGMLIGIAAFLLDSVLW